MDSGQNSLLTLVFLVVFVLIFLKLRSVLGRRTGDEPARYERFRAERAAIEAKAQAQAQTKSSGPQPDSKIVTLPRRERDAVTDAATGQDTAAERAHKMTQFAGGNSVLARGLIDVAAADRRFEPTEFLRGAKAAYEAIVMAFAEGNRARLKDLLSADVFDGFAAALDDRAVRKETIEQSFVGIKSAEINEAEVRAQSAMVTVTFVSELITATRNAAQEVINGDPKRVKEVTDIWTFARDVASTSPNWHLVATRAATA